MAIELLHIETDRIAFYLKVVLLHGILTGAPSMMLIEEEIMKVIFCGSTHLFGVICGTNRSHLTSE